MTEGGTRAAIKAAAPRRAWSALTGLIVVAINLIPLAGVALWGWDAFLLLMLYWMETVIVAFWTIVRIALAPTGGAGEPGDNAPQLVQAGFFTVHAGMFIGVHLLFLWILFSADWSSRTGSMLGFFRHAIGPEGLWVPLLAVLAFQAAIAATEILPGRMLHRYRPIRPVAPETARSRKERMDGVLLGLYGRIFAMQIAIVFGGWLALTLHTMAPLVLLVLCKAAMEFLVHVGRAPKFEA